MYSPLTNLLPIRPGFAGNIVCDKLCEKTPFEVLLPPDPDGLCFTFLHTKDKTIIFSVETDAILLPEANPERGSKLVITTPGTVIHIRGVADTWYVDSNITPELLYQ